MTPSSEGTRPKLWWHIYYGYVSEMGGYCAAVFGESTMDPEQAKATKPTDRNGELIYIRSVDFDPEDETDSLIAAELFDRLADSPREGS